MASITYTYENSPLYTEKVIVRSDQTGAVLATSGGVMNGLGSFTNLVFSFKASVPIVGWS